MELSVDPDDRKGFSWSRTAFANAARRVSSSQSAPQARAEPASSPAEASRGREATLQVHPQLGAGLEVSFVAGRGYVLESINDQPGQKGLEVGDLLVEVGGRSLALASEDEADEVLSGELRDGVRLRLLPASTSRSTPQEANNNQSHGDLPQKDATKEVSEEVKPGSHDALAGFLSSLFGGAQSSGAALAGSSALNDPAPQPDVDDEEAADELAEPTQKHRQTSNSEAGEEILGVPPLPESGPEPAEESWHEAPSPEPEVAHWEAAQETRKPEAEEDAEELMAFQPLHAASTTERQADDDPAESLPPLPSLAWSGRGHLAPAEADAAETQSEASASRSEMLVAAAPQSQGVVSAPRSKRAPDPGAARCKVADLRDWLEELRLDEYLDAATTWCAEMGAVSLEEIAENIEEFGIDVSLKPIERQRVQKWASQRLQGRGSARPLADVRGGSQGGPGRWEEPPLALARREMPQLPQWPEAQGRQARGFLPTPDSSSALAVPERDAPDETPIYTARSVRLAVDSMGNTGLDLRFDDDWGILVQSVDPLPGQPGLAEGDFIVAIEGCSLRHRSHEECDAVFSERLQNGAILSVVRPQSRVPAGYSGMRGKAQNESAMPNGWRLPRQPDFRNTGWGGGWSRGRRGGHDPNRMWNRFNRGPPW
ncbi:dnaaf1 [Symbiodinium sp. CCMP2592]|nr:dnaaf1 [Symbiodinium sp. CCMP2592]